MKKVLILSYYWPPGSGPGVQRWLKFTKFLPEFGWEPTVITVRDGSYPNIDPSLEEDVPETLRVIKTKTFEPFRLYNLLRGRKGKTVEVAMANVKGNPGLLARAANYIRSNYFIPDARMGWNRYSYPAAVQQIEENEPDVIITTGPPHSTHLVGLRLQQEFGIPWVADFRDPWTNIYYGQFLLRTERSKKKDHELEDTVLKNVSALLTATPGLKSEFEDRAEQAWAIPNGFDEEDFGGIQVTPHDKFTLGYVGNFKPQQNVETFWQALSELLQDEEFKAHFQLHITGNMSEQVADSITKYGLNDNIVVQAFVPHKQSIERMLASHVLLLPVPQDANNKRILTGKIFEYLATQRPILSMGPTDGDAQHVLTSCGKDPMIDYTDAEGIKAMLLRYYEAYKVNTAPQTKGNEHYKAYSRRGCTETLAKHLEEVTG